MHDAHGHHHGHIEGFDSLEQAAALMQYMLEHNKHHAAELHEVSHRLEHMDKSEAAYLIDAAVEHFNSGNEMLESALENLKKEI